MDIEFYDSLKENLFKLRDDVDVGVRDLIFRSLRRDVTSQELIENKDNNINEVINLELAKINLKNVYDKGKISEWLFSFINKKYEMYVNKMSQYKMLSKIYESEYLARRPLDKDIIDGKTFEFLKQKDLYINTSLCNDNTSMIVDESVEKIETIFTILGIDINIYIGDHDNFCTLYIVDDFKHLNDNVLDKKVKRDNKGNVIGIKDYCIVNPSEELYGEEHQINSMINSILSFIGIPTKIYDQDFKIKEVSVEQVKMIAALYADNDIESEIKENKLMIERYTDAYNRMLNERKINLNK